METKSIETTGQNAPQTNHDFGREVQSNEQQSTEIRVTVADNDLLRNKFKTGTSLADAYKNKTKKTIADYIDLGKWETW